MRRLSDCFGEAANRCASLRQLRSLLVAATRELGFRYFALLHHSSLFQPKRSYVRIDNYPPAWADELVATGLARIDPVHQASRLASAGFEWSELGRFMKLGPKQHFILERSRYFGIGDGLTLPVHVPGEPAGSCSFAVAAGLELPRRRIACAELIGAYAFRAARRLMNFPRSGCPPHLSRREVQCLRLVAAGKTDWEIAVILGISVETARQYLKHARLAYQAVTRAQLVVFGLRDQWLTFEDASEPSE